MYQTDAVKAITMRCYFLLFITIVSCNQLVHKSRPAIEATLNSHAATKSLKIKSYTVENYVEKQDSVMFYVQGYYSNNAVFNDTLRFAKKGDTLVTSNNN